MGFLRNLTALSPSNIKRGLDAARNPPSQAEIEASLASLTPEQRAAYDEQMARAAEAQAESQAAWEQAKEASEQARVLAGPAGRYLYGATLEELGSPDELHAKMREEGAFAVVRQHREQRRGEFKQALRQSFGMGEVKQIEDPDERARVAA